MKIQSIITRRCITNYKSGQIVYEWEDVYAHLLDACLVYDNDRRRSRLVKYIPFLKGMFIGRKPSLVFDMSWYDHNGLNSSMIIPIIIDFYTRDRGELNVFYRTFSHNPIVLISSLEVYYFLKSENCPLNIAHVGLSISDKYSISEHSTFEKKYDLVMLGRQNRVLKEYAMQYASRHPDFTYIYQKQVGTDVKAFDEKGKFVGNVIDRDDYMSLLSTGRSVLYSTPDIDTDGNRSHGFNQVTPRFLESIASGCHVIARYPHNPDVEYYELDKMVLSNVHFYNDFEIAMDYARAKDVDISRYSEYLKKHYTSVRVQEVKTIVENI